MRLSWKEIDRRESQEGFEGGRPSESHGAVTEGFW
jgi:hypothetical protein